MPLVHGKRIEDVFSPTQKMEITSTLTDATVPIEEEDMCSVSWADIEELLSDEWEIGGLAMTTEAIRALIAADQTI